MIGSAGPFAATLHPDADPSPAATGDNYHGTEVAGVLGALQNNGVGVYGVAPNAQIMALRACYPNSDDCDPGIDGIAANWGAMHGARVVSFSHPYYDKTTADLTDFIAALKNNPNTLFVTTVSLNSQDLAVPGAHAKYPCALSGEDTTIHNLICVTASDNSASGAVCPNLDYGSPVDLAADTQDGYTTNIMGGPNPPPGYPRYGTTGCYPSEASPAVAGVAATLFGLDPTATGADVKAAILAGVRQLPGLSGKVASGGELDAQGAVDAFQLARFQPVIQNATVSNVTSSGAMITGTVTNQLPGDTVVGFTKVPGMTVPDPEVTVDPATGQFTINESNLPPNTTAAVTLYAFANGQSTPHVVTSPRYPAAGDVTFTTAPTTTTNTTPTTTVPTPTTTTSTTTTTPPPPTGTRPTVDLVKASKLKKHKAIVGGLLRLRAHIATGGLDTSWRIDRKSGRTFTTVAQGTIPASAHDASVGVNVRGKPGKKLVWRVVEKNPAGTATQGPFTSRFPHAKRKK